MALAARHPPLPDLPAHTAPGRARLLDRALVLSALSVAFGLVSGGLSVIVGVVDHSLGVLATGLDVSADLAGSVVLIWRFRAERRHPVDAHVVEARAAWVIAATLAIVSVVLAVESVRALAAGTHPGGSGLTLATSALALVVLAPLAHLKRGTAAALGSEALRGDSTLSAIGAATAALALLGLVLFRVLGWWWADRGVALIVAVVAAAESWALVQVRRRSRTVG